MSVQLYRCPECKHCATREQMAAAGTWGKLSCPECGFEFYLKGNEATSLDEQGAL